jgi:hypothetical protein
MKLKFIDFNSDYNYDIIHKSKISTLLLLYKRETLVRNYSLLPSRLILSHMAMVTVLLAILS